MRVMLIILFSTVVLYYSAFAQDTATMATVKPLPSINIVGASQ